MIAVDTNVLLRRMLNDDEDQAEVVRAQPLHGAVQPAGAVRWKRKWRTI